MKDKGGLSLPSVHPRRQNNVGAKTARHPLV